MGEVAFEPALWHLREFRALCRDADALMSGGDCADVRNESYNRCVWILNTQAD